MRGDVLVLSAPIVCVLLLILAGCRDELSEREAKPAVPVGSKEGRSEHASAAAEGAGPSGGEGPAALYWPSSFSMWRGAVPFDLTSASDGTARKKFVLSGLDPERNAQAATSFEYYVRSGRGMRELAMVGARVENLPGKMVIHAESDLVISFESIGTDEPVEIHTHGRELLLIADRMGDLQVKTTEPGRDSGSVTVLALQSFGVRYDLRGADGADGSDGKCPEGFPGCLSDRSLRHPGRPLAYTIIDAGPEAFASPANSLAGNMSGAEEPVAGGAPSDPGCPPARAVQLERRETWEGAVQTVWKKKQVSWSDDRTGVPAYLSPGQPGVSGHRGGTLRLVVPALLTESGVVSPAVETSGGAAGRHGRHGWVGAEPAPYAAPLQIVHVAEHDARSVTRAVTLRYTWVRFQKRGLPAGGGSACGVMSQPLERSSAERPARPVWSEHVSEVVHPPETHAGRSLDLPDLPNAHPGEDGRVVRASLSETDLWALVGQKIPLPDSLAAALEQSAVSKQ